MNDKELLNLKQEIEENKNNLSKLKGKKELFMEQLKTDWDCDTIEEAVEKLEKMEKENERLQQKIENKTNELEKKYNELQNSTAEE